MRTPLKSAERLQTVAVLAQVIGAARQNKDLPDQAKRDLEGDNAALHRLTQLVKGEAIGRGDDQQNKNKGMSVAERLDDLVHEFGWLNENNFTSEDSRLWLGSMGGATEAAEDGQVHYQGYNGSLLYQFARARQIWGALEADPKRVREGVLEAAANGLVPDTAWIIEQPVTIEPKDTELKAAS